MRFLGDVAIAFAFYDGYADGVEMGMSPPAAGAYTTAKFAADLYVGNAARDACMAYGKSAAVCGVVGAGAGVATDVVITEAPKLGSSNPCSSNPITYWLASDQERALFGC